MPSGIAVIETHPVQYHAPVYRALQQQFGVPITAVYGSDFSVAGYRDPEFRTSFAWDTDLLSGYSALFLSRLAAGGSQSVKTIAASGLASALRCLDPAAVLLMGYSPRFYQNAILAGWSGRYPLLFRAETTDLGQRRGRLKRRLRDTLLRRLYQSCAALLYIGHHSHAHYRRLGVPEDRLIFSPYCVDADTFQGGEAERAVLRNTTRQSLGLAEDRLVVLFAGKLMPRKNPAMILYALKALPQQLREHISVMYLGDGQLGDQLRQLATLAPAIDCRFVGFQNQRALSRYYHAADMLVLPSAAETWGLVVNEALHHGLPCIVSDQVGCAPDLIAPGATGEVFCAGSVAALSQAFGRVLALVGRPETRARCRVQVSTYSVERAAEGIAAAYHTVVPGTRAKAP